ncbi:hypothetical protein J2S54_000029 [Streptomyces sp. DSM 42143]|nr:hypothetical protein [Streptomyces sp. DSM 42143]MDQ0383209.1 hypothetical protein [Streptomyces sp. DSM 42143]
MAQPPMPPKKPVTVPGGDLLQAAGRPVAQPAEEADEFVETTATTGDVERVAEGSGQRHDILVTAALVRRDEAPQQRGVGQPLLQETHGPARQIQALGRGAALDVGEQDRGVSGPVDVLRDQVLDAVGDDAGVDAE